MPAIIPIPAVTDNCVWIAREAPDCRGSERPRGVAG